MEELTERRVREVHASLARWTPDRVRSAAPGELRSALEALGDAFRACCAIDPILRTAVFRSDAGKLAAVTHAVAQEMRQVALQLQQTSPTKRRWSEVIQRRDAAESINEFLHALCLHRDIPPDRLGLHQLRHSLHSVDALLTEAAPMGRWVPMLGSRGAVRDWVNDLAYAAESRDLDWLDPEEDQAPRWPSCEMVTEYALTGRHAAAVEHVAALVGDFRNELDATLVGLEEEGERLGFCARRWLARKQGRSARAEYVISSSGSWVWIPMGSLYPVQAEADVVVDSEILEIMVSPNEDGAIRRVVLGCQAVTEEDGQGLWRIRARLRLQDDQARLRVDGVGCHVEAVFLRK
ncbi:MAG: hypothetical protein ACFB9M_16090 [Myxococcota bacterium]